MPIYGLGTWKLREEEAYNTTLGALKEGYRLIDTARMYENEVMVGKALKDSGLARNEYYVVSKLNPEKHGYESAKQNLKECLKDLDLDYVDLMLIHSCRGGKILETWKALCEMKKEGFAKSIGVSNFNIQHLEPLINDGLDVPSVNQFELHPWNQKKDTVKYCGEKGIVVMGYCPLARGRCFEDGQHPLIDELALKYKVTKAQVVLRWAIQAGYVTIPKSSKLERIKENAAIFDFVFTEDEMIKISGLDLQQSVSAADQAMQADWEGLA